MRQDITEDGLEIKLPTAVKDTIIFKSGFRNDPCSDFENDDEEGENLLGINMNIQRDRCLQRSCLRDFKFL